MHASTSPPLFCLGNPGYPNFRICPCTCQAGIHHRHEFLALCRRGDTRIRRHFYEKVCAVRERFGETEDQNELAPGTATNPGCEVYFWDEDYFVDGEYGEGGSSQRAWIKKALKSRAKDKDGGWVESANMQWYYHDTASSMTTLHVMIQDVGIDEDNKRYAHSTEIIIEVANYDYEL